MVVILWGSRWGSCYPAISWPNHLIHNLTGTEMNSRSLFVQFGLLWGGLGSGEQPGPSLFSYLLPAVRQEHLDQIPDRTSSGFVLIRGDTEGQFNQVS